MFKIRLRDISTIENIITLLYTILFGIGFYGFGRDYHNSYLIINWENFVNLQALGWRIAGLRIWNLAIGPMLAAFVMSSSLFFIIKKYLTIDNKSQKIIILLSYIALLHSWPIILPVANAIRQGIVTGLIYFLLAKFDSIYEKHKNLKNIFLLIPLILPSLLIHKIGGLFFILALLSSSVFLFKEKDRRNYLIISTILLFLFGYYFDFIIETPSRITGADMSLIFTLIAITFNLLVVFSNKFLYRNSFIFLFPFYMNIFALIFLANGYKLEFERLIMIVFIPQLICVLQTIKGDKKYILFLAFSFFSVFLTNYAGIYKAIYKLT